MVELDHPINKLKQAVLPKFFSSAMIGVIRFDHILITPQQTISPQEKVGNLRFHHAPKKTQRAISPSEQLSRWSNLTTLKHISVRHSTPEAMSG
jgi:hypothetical protein